MPPAQPGGRHRTATPLTSGASRTTPCHARGQAPTRCSFAEYVAVAHDGAIARRPDGLARAEAAELALSGAAAHTAVGVVGPRPGAVVLVAGATGGVGRHAVALAAHAGATVIATGKPRDEPSLRALGAALVVDHREDAAAAVRARYPGSASR